MTVALRHRLQEVLDRLADDYGLPDVWRSESGVDALVATILSQNTSRANSSAGFDRLKARLATWEQVADARVDAIERCIRVSGLSRITAPRIRAILRQIRAERGLIDLEHLADLPSGEAYRYLMAFDGVGPKTAWCTLLFGFGRDVFPVDTHIHRIARRLDWIGEKATAEQAHDLLGPHVPPGRGYDLHVLLIRHGRTTCRARNPRCQVCSLTDVCGWYRKQSSGLAV